MQYVVSKKMSSMSRVPSLLLVLTVVRFTTHMNITHAILANVRVLKIREIKINVFILSDSM